jgi:hypothetical protein
LAVFHHCFIVHCVFLILLLLQVSHLRDYTNVPISLVVLIIYHLWNAFKSVSSLMDFTRRKSFPWQTSDLVLALIENLLYILAYTTLAVYLSTAPIGHVFSYGILIPTGLACCLNCLCRKQETTPCNSTMLLLSRVTTALRLLVGLSVFLKVDVKTQWDWSSTFWPYWCSFAIQSIMGIASFIIFVNTVLNYYKEEAIIEDSKSLSN